MAENEDQQKPDRVTALCNRRVDGPYTVFPNAIVQSKDIKLTPNEFRVLTYIASLPEDWELRIGQVAQVCDMGRDAVYDAIYGLQDHRLARHLIARERGRIKARRWEFTLTPGLFLEPEDPLFLEIRIKRKKLVPEKPDLAQPDQVRPTLQKTDRTQSKEEKKQQSDCASIIQDLVVVSDAATRERTPSKPWTSRFASKTGSAMEENPELWPFADDLDVTKRVRATGIEPQAVWDKFRDGVAARKIQIDSIKNLAGYLVGMARKMAKEAYGPADPAALKRAAAALSARASSKPIDPAIYERILAEEDAERQAARPPKTFKPGGYRGQRALKRY